MVEVHTTFSFGKSTTASTEWLHEMSVGFSSVQVDFEREIELYRFRLHGLTMLAFCRVCGIVYFSAVAAPAQFF